MKRNPIQISLSDYKYHSEQNDGICSACYAWTFNRVHPDQEHGQCLNCNESRLCGIKVAKILELIEVT